MTAPMRPPTPQPPNTNGCATLLTGFLIGFATATTLAAAAWTAFT